MQSAIGEQSLKPPYQDKAMFFPLPWTNLHFPLVLQPMIFSELNFPTFFMNLFTDVSDGIISVSSATNIQSISVLLDFTHIFIHVVLMAFNGYLF